MLLLYPFSKIAAKLWSRRKCTQPSEDPFAYVSSRIEEMRGTRDLQSAGEFADSILLTEIMHFFGSCKKSSRSQDSPRFVLSWAEPIKILWSREIFDFQSLWISYESVISNFNHKSDKSWAYLAYGKAKAWHCGFISRPFPLISNN